MSDLVCDIFERIAQYITDPAPGEDVEDVKAEIAAMISADVMYSHQRAGDSAPTPHSRAGDIDPLEALRLIVQHLSQRVRMLEGATDKTVGDLDEADALAAGDYLALYRPTGADDGGPKDFKIASSKVIVDPTPSEKVTLTVQRVE